MRFNAFRLVFMAVPYRVETRALLYGIEERTVRGRRLLRVERERESKD